MQRKEWFELHDHRLFPCFMRDLVTDGLEALWDITNSYRVIVPRLQAAMDEAGTGQIVDLCSGGGGPWLRLRQEFTDEEGLPIRISLTDKFPNHKAFARASAISGLDFCSAPVDATCIPAELNGFRTIFSSFHHFNPEDTRAMLADAVAQRQGIAVFEAPKCDLRTLLALFMVPVLCWYVTPRIRPLRGSRFLWTYLLPVVPFTLFVDGVLSCLRSYSLDDLRELTDGLGGEDYRWEIGEERGGRIGITYLIGRPSMRSPVDAELAAAAD
jgi:hypothetical protein